MKKIIDFLRKIGLLHIGSGDYMTGEFDSSSKEMVNENSEAKENKNDKGRVKMTGGSLLFWILSGVGIIIVLFSLIILGFSFWFFVVLIIWIWFIYSIKTQIFLGNFVLKKIIVNFGIVFLFSFVFVIIGVPNNNSVNNNSGEINNSQNNERDISDVSICRSEFLEYKPVDYINLQIVDNKYKDKTKKEYTEKEIYSLSSQANIQIDREGVYTTVQLCKKENAVTFTHLKAFYLHQEKDSSESKTSVELSSFDQMESRMGPDEYQLYVYYSRDGENWFIDEKLDFVVK